MSLAIFDLDYTLINGDSDFLWGEYLSDIGAVNAKEYREKNDFFFNEYKKNSLDIFEFLNFSLKPLSNYPIEKLNKWHYEFIKEKILPIISKKALNKVKEHKKNDDILLVITATNDFITKPIVKLFGINNLLATRAEFINGKYTGKPCGTPCYGEGKVKNLQKWLKTNNLSLTNSYFYSDSITDLPLLNLVDNPIVVNADEKLQNIAKNNNWKILNWLD